jgi:hypothetical protein
VHRGSVYASTMGSVQVSCASCGEVIGVYEPMIVVVDGLARETSQAAEQEWAEVSEAVHYHRGCYESTVD